MWAMIAGMVRPLPLAVFPFQAAGGIWSIRYWLMRLLVLKAFSRATGSSAAKTLPREGASVADGASGMIRRRPGSTPWQEPQFGISCRHLQGVSFPQRF